MIFGRDFPFGANEKILLSNIKNKSQGVKAMDIPTEAKVKILGVNGKKHLEINLY